MGRVRASRPVSTRPRRPCPFFCAAKSNFKVPMVLILFSVSPVFSRASAEVGGALYPRVGAGRLMFGTPAARRPYLFNDLVSAPRNAPLPKLVGMARRSAASFQSRQRGSQITAMQMSSASFQSAQFSVAPARKSDHGDANEFSQFSVSPVFSRASAGVRSRLAGIGGQKTNRKQARLWKFSFFESHIRATNAPARRSSIMTRSLPLS